MSTIDYQLFNGLEARYIDPQKLQFPGDSIVLYAIENNEIIGRMAIVQLPHIEGTWIREDKRSGTLGLRLISKIESVIEEANKTAIFSFVHDSQPEIADYMKRLGYELMPLRVYMKPLVNNSNKES